MEEILHGGFVVESEKQRLTAFGNRKTLFL